MVRDSDSLALMSQQEATIIVQDVDQVVGKTNSFPIMVNEIGMCCDGEHFHSFGILLGNILFS